MYKVIRLTFTLRFIFIFKFSYSFLKYLLGVSYIPGPAHEGLFHSSKLLWIWWNLHLQFFLKWFREK